MEEEEFVFVSETEVCTYKPYTFWRIKRILAKYYDCRLENIWQGYKSNRRPGYCEIYKIVQNYDNKVILTGVKLDALRKIFARKGYPLNDEEDVNLEAVEFLEIVNNIKNNKN